MPHHKSILARLRLGLVLLTTDNWPPTTAFPVLDMWIIWSESPACFAQAKGSAAETRSGRLFEEYDDVQIRFELPVTNSFAAPHFEN